jgi:RES domain-containing protein
VTYPFRPLSVPLWRMLPIRFQTSPMSGEGARLFGGRWNPRGTLALYLATDPATAVAEYYQGLARPGTLAPYRVDARRIALLTNNRGEPVDDAVRCALEANWKADERGGRSPSSWILAERLLVDGAEGALMPSVQNRGGTNLVLWRWHDARLGAGDGAALTLLDPEQALG